MCSDTIRCNLILVDYSTCHWVQLSDNTDLHLCAFSVNTVTLLSWGFALFQKWSFFSLLWINLCGVECCREREMWVQLLWCNLYCRQCVLISSSGNPTHLTEWLMLLRRPFRTWIFIKTFMHKINHRAQWYSCRYL